MLGLEVLADQRQQGGEDGGVIREAHSPQEVGHGVRRQDEIGQGRQHERLGGAGRGRVLRAPPDSEGVGGEGNPGGDPPDLRPESPPDPACIHPDDLRNQGLVGMDWRVGVDSPRIYVA